MADKAENVVQEMYANTPAGTRGAFAGDKDKASAYYSDFVGFVRKVAPVASGTTEGTRLLDVGCGCGWSSFAFSQAGYDTTGIDLNAAAFEPPPSEKLTLLEASATKLPFDDCSFDVIAAYQCIEHVPDPEAALREMMRVCRAGGTICVVGPNLVSPVLPLKVLAAAVARRDPLAWKRTAGMPRHPYGNTVPETLASVPVNLARLVRKIVATGPGFTMREPDMVPPFHSDNDACYLCNPTDFLKFFPRHGCKIVHVGKPGRLPLAYLLAGGTWIAARKS